MNKIKLSYGICTQNCEIQNRNTNKKQQLVEGELIRILESEYHNGSGDATSDAIIVKLYNAEDNNFKTDMFECSKKYTDYIFENLWLFLIGTKDSHTRLLIYRERESVLALRVGVEILIKTYDNDNNANIRGVVHLIGPIQDAGIGNFVGLKLLLSQPEKPQTMLNLHKRHYNANLQLHIFRIEQLLDALKHGEQNSGQQERSNKTVENKKPIELNLASCNISEKVPIEHNFNSTNPFLPIADDPPNISFNTQKISGQDKIVSNGELIATQISELSHPPNILPRTILEYAPLSKDPPIPRDLLAVYRSFSERDQKKTPIYASKETVSKAMTIPSLNDEKSTLVKLADQPKEMGAIPKGINSTITKRNGDFRGSKMGENVHKLRTNCPETIKPDATPVVPTKPQTTNLFDSICDSGTSPSSSGCTLLKPVNASDAQINTSCTPTNNKSTCIKQTSNEKSTIPKTDALARITKKKIRAYSDKKHEKIPNWKHSLQCGRCNRPFGHDMLLLKCKHCICAQCFGTKISSLIGTNRVRCPFTTTEGICNYYLKNFELEQLRQKLAKFVLSPTEDNPSLPAKRNYSDGEEELFECKTAECAGKWFISKFGFANLYECPLCKIKNCVHCLVIHDNMTCTDYKNRLIPNAQQNETGKIENVVVSLEPEGAIASESKVEESEATIVTNQQILEDSSGAGPGTLYKCQNENCTGQCSILKGYENMMYKCPTCQLYNCFMCKAIHQDQTCNEYQEAKRPRNTPVAKSPYSDTGSNNFNARRFPSNARTQSSNNLPKRKWRCAFCTFDNYNSGNKCYMCRKINS